MPNTDLEDAASTPARGTNRDKICEPGSPSEDLVFFLSFFLVLFSIPRNRMAGTAGTLGNYGVLLGLRRTVRDQVRHGARVSLPRGPGARS